MFCSKCGKEISDDSYFCEHCGNKVRELGEAKKESDDEIEIHEEATELQSETESDVQNYVQDDAGQESKSFGAPNMTSTHKRWIIPLVIIIVLMAAAAFTKGTDVVSVGNIDDDAASYKQESTAIKYSDFRKNHAKYTDRKLKFTGQIYEMKSEDGVKVFVLDTKFDEDYDMYVGDSLLVKYEGEANVDNYDTVTIYGETTGDEEKPKSAGNLYDKLPVVKAKYIDVGR